MNLEFLFRRRVYASFPAVILALAVLACTPSARAQTSPAQSAEAQAAAPFLYAKFESSLNTKKAKVGDEFKAKTVKNLRLKDLDIPKGSQLVGTVTAVQSRKEGNGDSSLTIRFDHVELKSGTILQIQGLIVSIAEVSDTPGGMGPTSVLSRGGVGSTSGVDPNLEVDKGVQDDIPPGSSLPGVALGTHLGSDGTSQLRGVHTEIKFDSDTEIKVALFRGK